MHHDFWHQRWQTQQIGFHKSEVNPFLLAHFQALRLPTGTRVFVPLCGKSLDISWLLAHGFQVVGVELSQLAVDALFTELGLTPEITISGSLSRYYAENIEIFQGDFFELSHQQLGHVDATYDRAALIALPTEMRKQYCQHLMNITQTAPQLLISLAYDQSLIAGPPFSVNAAEVSAHYEPTYTLATLSSSYQAKGLKGQFPVDETAWLLWPR